MQLLISTVCMALTSAVVGNAYLQKKQFYPAVVYITKSNASMAVIYVQFFVIVFMIGKLLRKIFLGTLRAAEFEHLLERFWYALTETCLAFTVFRDDFHPRFVALFTVLLFLKSFHWLAEERVDFMERSPVLGWLFHIRVASLLTILGILDHVLLMHAYNSTLSRGPTVQLVFGFEYAILLTVVASTIIKYVLHTAEMGTDNPWENKAVFLLYTELVIGLIRVVLYVLFVVIMAKIYALPMFVFRPMFFTIRNFKKALSDVIMSRRAIRNMNTLYPDATPEELRLSDNICIICREDMVNHSKKLPCGHIFHTTCLRSWFQRQQTCPTCRLNILRTPNTNSTAIPRQEEPPVVAPEQQQQQQQQQAAAAVVAAAAAANAANLTGLVNLVNLAPPATPVHWPQNPMLNAEQTPTADAAVNNPIPLLTQPTQILGLTGNQPLPTGLTPTPLPPPPPPSSFMMAPPPFSLIPYGVPPPPMPSDLTILTDDELRAMEGNERRNIEERIRYLHNIQLLLDAASVLMTNYQSVAASQQALIAQTTAAKTNNNENPTMGGAPINDGPSTSANCSQQSNLETTTTTTAAAAASNVPTTTSTKQSLTSTAAEAVGATTTTTPATSSPHNEVTIEDIGGEEHEYQKSKNNINALSSTSTLISNTNNNTNNANQTENAELSELRKRRLKFLEERNKTSTAPSTD